ncbi:hypothetical protein BVC80_23g39 [Macleaya cordata]|uniref:RNase H type-1 domain-containing protein n=1 Tax=Macleaya cordata TaxID=56857 RepID=A0A200PPT7_MACCD|nr:hypothetical protein BVC80_23g39 [Macleaya cordata]
MEIDIICVLYCSNVEDDRHLFFSCPYSQSIWRGVLAILGLSRGVQIQWCTSKFSGKSPDAILKKLAFNSYIYHIWAERNMRCFTEKRNSTDSVLHQIIEVVRIKFLAQNIKVPDKDRNRSLFNKWSINVNFTLPRTIQYVWNKPLSDEFMINTAGSLSQSGAGYSDILRDHIGDAIAAVSGTSRPLSITIHELQGIEAGLLLASEYSISCICIASDSKVAVSYFSSKNKEVPWRATRVWKRIQRLTKRFEICNIVHIYRETNRAADYLAKLRHTTEFLVFTPCSFAQDLKDIVFEDKMGKLYFHF